MANERLRYKGGTRKLVLAFDVGTTFSGVAYTILYPGLLPQTSEVTRFPGQDSGDSRIPSVMYYTPTGQMRAAGAEARRPEMKSAARKESLFFVEWFKLHLCPQNLKPREIGQTKEYVPPPLPPGKNAVDVFADFLSYLFKCARNFIQQSHADGEKLWASVQDNIDIVLSHPNGWEGPQQAQMRTAACIAGLIPIAEDDRLRFVSEGHASIQYCLGSGIASEPVLDNGSTTIMLIDAGGGTVDIVTYRVLSLVPLSLAEIAPDDCLLQGSTRVDARAEEYFKRRLKGTRYVLSTGLNRIRDRFVMDCKHRFACREDDYFLDLGEYVDDDPRFGIQDGLLEISGADMAKLFEPSVAGIVDAVKKQRKYTNVPISMAFLVGGFSGSDWMYSQLKLHFDKQRISISRPDSKLNKAVAHGAVSFYLQDVVSRRISKCTYGVKSSRLYDKGDPGHKSRKSSLYYDLAGDARIPGHFDHLIRKGDTILENREITESYDLKCLPEDVQRLSTEKTTIYRYCGQSQAPAWVDLAPNKIKPMCSTFADFSAVPAIRREGPKGSYYVREYKIIIAAGGTELKAQISWEENGIEKRGPATIVWAEF
ncbi:hypothetical protein PsYK624_000260 [Phanerochaete sordida]|uniref:Actin-like ATPase domain-containing protein n=1 Tax=Phanerochaete sordida TaxID=48140 RepID=A0A9P3L7F6_9APHY|nr:hypothetical protein PsYK624_000260 [Phanerochaete sordida]